MFRVVERTKLKKARRRCTVRYVISAASQLWTVVWKQMVGTYTVYTNTRVHRTTGDAVILNKFGAPVVGDLNKKKGVIFTALNYIGPLLFVLQVQ